MRRPETGTAENLNIPYQEVTMKRSILGAIIATAVIGSVTLLGGCATMRGQETAKAPTGKMEKAQADMKQTVVQVDATTASLNTLVEPDQVALKKAYDEFSNNVDRMEKLAKQVGENDATIRSEGTQYFTQLQQQETKYSDAELRKASSDRRSELSQVYNRVPEANRGLNEALTAYVADLKQIETYLSTDLTPKGVESMRPVAQKALRDGEMVKNLASPVISAMSQAITAMTPGSAGAAAGGLEK